MNGKYIEKFIFILFIFQTGQENTPLFPAVCDPHLDSSIHLLKQCSVRLERLPFGNELLNLHCPTLQSESLDRNGKYLKKNLYCSIMKGNSKRSVNHSSENPWHQKQSSQTFKCNKCDYFTTRASTLKRHFLYKHTSVKPFICKECNYSATELSSLKRHLLYKHTFDKPFKCNSCDYSCNESTNLKRHVLAKHTLELPFKCDECDYSSLYLRNLKRHVQNTHIFVEPQLY